MVVGQFTEEAQLVVIGGGAAGCAAALRGAELGLQTVLVSPRGLCPHLEWAHTLAMSDAARLVRAVELSAQYGLDFGRPRVDLQRLHQWTDQISEALTTQLEHRFSECGVEIVRGTVEFDNARELTVQGDAGARLKFKRAVIATGAAAVAPAGGWPDSPRVTDAHRALQLDTLPRKLLVIGGGPSAVEAAGAFSLLGSQVVLACPSRRLLPEADEDLVRPLERRLTRQVAELVLGAEVTALEDTGRAVTATLEIEGAARSSTVDHVIVAMGRRPHSAALGLDKAQVRTAAEGRVYVDEQLRTSNPRVLAVGEVTGEPVTTGEAVHQGTVAAEVAAGRDSVFDSRATPLVVFSDPPMAWCGLTESRAAEQGLPVKVVTMPWTASGRAISLAQTDGLTRLITDPDSGLVLGLGIVGAGAEEMIGEGALAIEMGATAEDLAGVIHPHPTMGELIAAAAQRSAGP